MVWLICCNHCIVHAKFYTFRCCRKLFVQKGISEKLEILLCHGQFGNTVLVKLSTQNWNSVFQRCKNLDSQKIKILFGTDVFHRLGKKIGFVLLSLSN